MWAGGGGGGALNQIYIITYVRPILEYSSGTDVPLSNEIHQRSSKMKQAELSLDSQNQFHRIGYIVNADGKHFKRDVQTKNWN